LTMPTHHEKISIAKVRSYAYEEAGKAIEELLDINRHHQNNEVVLKMKHIVPEFLSKNSVFEELDGFQDANSLS